MHTLKLITTSDGSHSLYREDLREGYHSHHGALQESQHVFIKHGLEAYTSDHTDGIIRILEVGFGTGLNALLTWQFVSHTQVQVEYTGVEAYPVPQNIWQRLNFASLLEESSTWETRLKQLHEIPWGKKLHPLDSSFSLMKREEKIEETPLAAANYDIVYFDAFAPNKQEELWTPALFQKLSASLKPGGFLTTYCAKGQFKRDLKAVGFEVETLPGAPGKAEMVRGKKI